MHNDYVNSGELKNTGDPAPPPPTEYGTQPQFHTQVLRTSSTEKILKSPPPTQLSIYSVE